MELAEIKRLPFNNKTVAQWHQEVRAQAHHFTIKYEQSFHSLNSSTHSMMAFYRKAQRTYFAVNELLYHLNTFGSIYDKKCLSCKHENMHVEKLKRSFNKYYPLILKCKDGYRFREVSVLRNDI